MTDRLSPTDVRKAATRVLWGIGSLAAGVVSTRYVSPGLLPACVCAGAGIFVLCWRSALRIVRIDKAVFDHSPIWSAPRRPAPAAPVRSATPNSRRLALVSELSGNHRQSIPAAASVELGAMSFRASDQKHRRTTAHAVSPSKKQES